MTRRRLGVFLLWPIAFAFFLAVFDALTEEDPFLESLMASAVIVAIATLLLVQTAGALRLLPAPVRFESLLLREVGTVLLAALQFSLILQFLALVADEEFFSELVSASEGASGFLLTEFFDDFFSASFILAVHWFFLCVLPGRQSGWPAARQLDRQQTESIEAPGPEDRRAAGQHAPPPAPDEDHAAPVALPTRARVALVERFPELQGCRIWALEAQEHYVKVYSDHGNRTLHYRFSHAVEDLAALDGLQVHRSYWVNREAVTGHSQEGRRLVLKLRNGLQVPVSLSFRRAAAAAGLLESDPASADDPAEGAKLAQRP